MSPSLTDPFWVCIPARRSSTRLANKPLADIAGWPMVLWVVRQAMASKACRVIVATDDAEIYDIVMRSAEAGLKGLPPGTASIQRSDQASFVVPEAVMTRADHPSGTDRLAELASLLQADPAQVILNLQGDEPLIDPEILNRVAQRLSLDPKASVATAACPIHDPVEFQTPHAVKVVSNRQGHALYFSRAAIPFWRDAPPGRQMPSIDSSISAPTSAYLRHIGLYAFRAGPLQDFSRWPESPLEAIERLEQLRWLDQGHIITLEILEHAPPAGVDTADDLVRVRKALSFGTPSRL